MGKHEPVAWIYEFYADMGHKGLSFEEQPSAYNTPLYTAPPHHASDVKKREWAGLTDEEVDEIYMHEGHEDVVLLTQAKLKEKNT